MSIWKINLRVVVFIAKRISFAALGYFLLFVPFLSAAEAEQSCLQITSEVRGNLLEKIHQMEYHYVYMKWVDWKYRYFIYHQLWEALHAASDSFSPEKRAQGSVLQERYEHTSQALLEEIQEEKGDLFSALKELNHALESDWNACPALYAKDCFSMWRDQTHEVLSEFEKYLTHYIDEQTEARDKIHETLNETPSEHHDFGHRYQDLHARWLSELEPQIFTRLSRVKEKVESEWPEESCCAFCTAENVEAAEDELYQLVRPDPEASLGAEGGALNKQNIAKAFKDLED